METKNQETKVQWIKRALHFQQCYIVDPEGISRRVVAIWTNKVEVIIEYSGKHFVNLSLMERGDVMPCVSHS